MSNADYKKSIKNLVDSINDTELLKQWKEQLEWDVKNGGEIELTDEEWLDVQEGLEDCKNGRMTTLEEFINRK